MRINKLTIENFRSYQAKTEFIFKGENDINMIIGQNGTGKTSFLSAIKYVLFGPKMYGSELYTNDYLAWVKNEINYQSTSNTFEIGLQFVYNDQVIDVIRTSIITDKYIEEVEVYINDTKQKDARVLENFNYNLFNYIFFNGENISSLTSNVDSMNKFIAEIIDVYFELNIFKQIIKDTEASLAKDIKKVATNEYNVLVKDLKANRRLYDNKDKSIKNLQSDIESCDLKINQLEADMKKYSALSTEAEKEIKDKIDSWKSQVDEQEMDIVNFLKTTAHQLLMRKQLIGLNDQLKQSRAERKKDIENLFTQLSGDKPIDIKTVLTSDFKTEIKIFNHLCEDNEWEIRDNISQYNKAKKNLKTNQTKLSKSEEGNRIITYDVNYEFLLSHRSELENNYERVVRKKEELGLIGEKLSEQIKIEKKKMLDDVLVNNSMIEKNNLIEISNIYISKQSEKVFHQVAGSMNEILKHHLLRKDNLIDSISIVNYKLQIIKDKKIRPINSFSSGEQQLILIAFIFAVLKQARVDVPLILDTFFARIDDLQQDNLIQFLSTNLSNQILFIATDSELPQSKIAKFKNINKVYKLENEGYNTLVGVVNEN